MTRPTGRGAAIALCAAGLLSCGQPAQPRLVRLAPSLGRAEIVNKADRTRPCLLLTPGETRSCPVRLVRGSRLAFALGIGPSPDEGFLRFRVRLGGRTVFERRVFAGNRNHWWDASIPLDAEGPATLEFRGDHVLADGQPFPTAVARPWVQIASPRLYVPARGPRRRVLVWISQDTVRADHLSAYGYRRATTSRFEGAAPGSFVFERAVSPASWTLPALVSQFTSRYPTFHGATAATVYRDESQPTLFGILASEGFTVVGATGNHFVSSAFHTAAGFDLLQYTEGHAAEVNRLVLEGLGQWGGGDLAVFVHYMDPHAPYDPPRPYGRQFVSLFDPAYKGRVTGRNFEGLAVATLTPADVDHVRAVYDAELAYADLMIGELLDALRAMGLLDDAVVAYSADHGEEFQEHGGWTHSRTLYEEMLHVPFAIRVPGLRGRRVADVVSLVDLAPTVLDALGVASPPMFQGRSLLGLLRGGTLPDAPVFAETERNRDGNHRVAVREGSLKCVLVVQPGREVPPQILKEEFYDLASDPGEHAPLPPVAGLRKDALEYLTRARSAKAGTPAQLPPELEEKLRALGYLQ